MARLTKHERRRHELRSYVNDRDRTLIETGAELEGMSVSDFLRCAALCVAREHLGLEVYDRDALVESVLAGTEPAEA